MMFGLVPIISAECLRRHLTPLDLTLDSQTAYTSRLLNGTALACLTVSFPAGGHGHKVGHRTRNCTLMPTRRSSNLHTLKLV